MIRGGKVLLRNVVFSNKLTPTFDSTEYEVVQTNGSEVEITEGGKTFRRNISHVKKLPTTGLIDTANSSSVPTQPPVQTQPSVSTRTTLEAQKYRRDVESSIGTNTSQRLKLEQDNSI